MASAKVIDQKEYLKRYLSGKDKSKKKRKKSKAAAGATGRGLSIVDDNLEAATIDVEEEETNLYELAENAPMVAGVFDDRPIHVQARETFGAKWKSLAADEPEIVDQQPGRSVDSDDMSPPRKIDKLSRNSRRRNDSDSDASPPRRKASPDFSPPRKKSSPARRDSGRGPSRRSPSPRRRTNDSRGHRRDSPKRHRRRSDSPSRKDDRRRQRSRDSSPPRRSSKPRSSRDADLSPPRRKRTKSSDSDISPPRNKSDQKRRRNSDSDLSPPRLGIKIKEEPVDPDDDVGCTLEGKKAGLQDARSVKAELEALRKKEHEHFRKMSDHVSGRGAQAVYRDRKSGRRRDLEQEEKQTAEELVIYNKFYFIYH